MQILMDQLLTGLTLGSLYALVALGLTLTFGVVRLINFAHGGFFTVAAYLFWILQTQLKVPYVLSAGFTVLGLAVFGAIFELVIVHSILERPWHIHAVATLAVSTALVSAVMITFGTSPRAAPNQFAGMILEFGEFRISLQRIIILGVTIAAFAILDLFVGGTKTGKAMRAMSQNREVCKALGIDVRRIALVTFAIGAALAGLAAAFVIPVFVIVPDVGTVIMLKAFATIIVGGMGNVRGTIYGAFLLGVTEALFAGYISSEYAPAAPFLMMILVLLIKPHGLFGIRTGL